jgi:hypothetical protein
MFNVFLPTLLEYRANDGNSHSDAETSLDGPLWEVLLFTLAGTPGAPVSATVFISASNHSNQFSSVHISWMQLRVAD